DRAAVLRLEAQVAEAHAISGLIPICAACKRIRNEQGAWETVEEYIRDRSQSEFSHGLCPHCGESWESQVREMRERKTPETPCFEHRFLHSAPSALRSQ
ncbi:MAG TPA: hypothetical protein VEG32_10010, partial [Clostridia bacterium]|nr:hypothetical protein [Clostridia bacterium]